MSILSRIFSNWKMTVGGASVGLVAMGLIAAILNQAGCAVSLTQWVEILTAAFAGPTIVGAMGTDNGTKVG